MNMGSKKEEEGKTETPKPSELLLILQKEGYLYDILFSS